MFDLPVLFLVSRTPRSVFFQGFAFSDKDTHITARLRVENNLQLVAPSLLTGFGERTVVLELERIW